MAMLYQCFCGGKGEELQEEFLEGVRSGYVPENEVLLGRESTRLVLGAGSSSSWSMSLRSRINNGSKNFKQATSTPALLNMINENKTHRQPTPTSKGTSETEDTHSVFVLENDENDENGIMGAGLLSPRRRRVESTERTSLLDPAPIKAIRQEAGRDTASPSNSTSPLSSSSLCHFLPFEYSGAYSPKVDVGSPGLGSKSDGKSPKLAAAEQTQMDAEEQTQRETEGPAQRKVEEQARQGAEGQAQREAEEQAQREAEEQAQRESEEQAQREAEEQAQREAEEQAQREAEEQALREAEEQALREAEEQAQREAEEQAQREAEEQAEREAQEERKEEEKQRVARKTEAFDYIRSLPGGEKISSKDSTNVNGKLRYGNALAKKTEFPLHRAVRENRADIVKYLLENGADRNIRNSKKRTALDWYNKSKTTLALDPKIGELLGA